MKDICICILAHNEQKHIAETIEAIAENSLNLNCDIKVYANGCTDRTVEIVCELTSKYSNLSSRVLDVASKPNAWNTAFYENTHSVLVFSDGDVVPETGALDALAQLLTEKHSKIVLAGCTFWPRNSGLTIGQRFVGFLQIPLCQNFLSGQLYAIRREKFAQEWKEKNILGIPFGIVAEDTFLEKLVSTEMLTIISHKVYYEPPSISDYWKYLARMRWQEEQLASMYSGVLNDRVFSSSSIFVKVAKKNLTAQNIKRLLLGFTACGLRCAVKMIFWSRIYKHYRDMGLVKAEGGDILSIDSRSNSSK